MEPKVVRPITRVQLNPFLVPVNQLLIQRDELVLLCNEILRSLDSEKNRGLTIQVLHDEGGPFKDWLDRFMVLASNPTGENK